MKQKLNDFLKFFEGKKTYIAGIAGLIYGILQNEKEIILISLGLLGLRSGITNEISRLMKK